MYPSPRQSKNLHMTCHMGQLLEIKLFSLSYGLPVMKNEDVSMFKLTQNIQVWNKCVRLHLFSTSYYKTSFLVAGGPRNQGNH